MTSTDAVKNEIERFLKSSDPEVICITGDWGVGKTYTWQTILDRLRQKHEVGLWRYSYVSMFGLNSLDALKTAIFENMEILAPQGRAGFEWLVSGGNSAFKNSKSFISLATAVPVVGGYVAKAQPFLFSSIRNQIVCIDDLERRGTSLSVKDVFGLISFLREQRGCKVILLLNQTQLDQDQPSKTEFADYFEKVIDTKLVFAPTPSDAVSIAIDANDDLSKLIALHCAKLQISNIRVIKKIERLVRMIDPVIDKFGVEIKRQTVHSIAMFGWCKFDAGAKPPPMDYMRKSSLGRYVDRKNSKESPNADETRWDAIFADYDWNNLDELDIVLFKFVEKSLLDVGAIEKCAHENQLKHDRMSKAGSFEQSWRQFHDNFSDNESEVCDALVAGFRNSFDVLTRRNLDEVLTILRELNRREEAEALIEFAEREANNDFWISDDPFERDMRDTRLNTIAEQRKEAAKPAFDFETDLVLAAQDMDRTKQGQLAAVPAEQYQHLFESRTGEQLRRVILSAIEYRRILNASDDMLTIVRKAEAALRAIGKKSKLNELRVQKYGVPMEGASSDKADRAGEAAGQTSE